MSRPGGGWTRGRRADRLTGMKLRAIVTAALVVAVLALAGWGALGLIRQRPKPKREQRPRPPLRVTAEKITARKNYRVVVRGYGSLRPRSPVDIIPMVSGNVVWRATQAFSGRHVRKGQELFRIERKDFELARQVAGQRLAQLTAQAGRLDQEEKNLLASKKIEMARIELAQRLLTDTRDLRKRGAAGDSDVDQADEAHLARRSLHQNLVNQLALIGPQRLIVKAETAVAQAQLEQAELDFARTTYVSPVTGRIGACLVREGQPVKAGQVCGSLYATARMEVPVAIPAAESLWLGLGGAAEPKPGQVPAEITWRGGRKRVVWRGWVDRVEAGLEPQARTARVVVTLEPRPPAADEETAPDVNMFCDVKLLGRTLERVFLLPRRAIDPDERVYVIEDGRLARRRVKVALYTTDEAVVLPDSGIEEGDRVIISQIPRPVLGMRVKAVASGATVAPASRPAP